MKKCLIILIALLFITGLSGSGLADNAGIMKEIQALRERIEELEQKLEEQESLAKRQAAETEKSIDEKTSRSPRGSVSSAASAGTTTMSTWSSGRPPAARI